jgi:hypothetical protein
MTLILVLMTCVPALWRLPRLRIAILAVTAMVAFAVPGRCEKVTVKFARASLADNPFIVPVHRSRPSRWARRCSAAELCSPG